MSSNRELEAIRQKRLIELRQQLDEEQQKTKQRQASQVQKQSLLREILTSEARQRLNRIKLVKPDFIAQLELQLIQIAQTGRVKLPINDEQLKQMLIQTVDIMDAGARLVVITYHSLEDRLVKNFMRAGNFTGNIEKDIYGNFKVPFKQINHKVITPDENEILKNKRARSAKLRIAERI